MQWCWCLGRRSNATKTTCKLPQRRTSAGAMSSGSRDTQQGTNLGVAVSLHQCASFPNLLSTYIPSLFGRVRLAAHAYRVVVAVVKIAYPTGTSRAQSTSIPCLCLALPILWSSRQPWPQSVSSVLRFTPRLRNPQPTENALASRPARCRAFLRAPRPSSRGPRAPPSPRHLETPTRCSPPKSPTATAPTTRECTAHCAPSIPATPPKIMSSTFWSPASTLIGGVPWNTSTLAPSAAMSTCWPI